MLYSCLYVTLSVCLPHPLPAALLRLTSTFRIEDNAGVGTTGNRFLIFCGRSDFFACQRSSPELLSVPVLSCHDLGLERIKFLRSDCYRDDKI